MIGIGLYAVVGFYCDMQFDLGRSDIVFRDSDG